jgi:hypothetical protein
METLDPRWVKSFTETLRMLPADRRPITERPEPILAKLRRLIADPKVRDPRTLQVEDILTWLRIEMEEPNSTNFKMESAPCTWFSPCPSPTEKEDPILAKVRNDKLEPRWAAERMLKLLPKRPKDLTEKVEPMLAMPKIDAEPPTWAFENTDSEEPKCANALADMEEPKRVSSSTETLPTNRACDRRDKLLPKAKALMTEHFWHDPRWPMPCTEAEDPRRAKERTEKEDPILTNSSADTFAPSLAKFLNEKEDPIVAYSRSDTAEPRRPQLLKDIELPRWIASKTDRRPCMFVCEKTEIAEPRRR